MQKGFTLIELLVVVLIIGILASVALPTYTRAVDKARATEALSAMKTLVDAQNIYYLANNNYTDELEELDITVPEMKDFYISSIRGASVGSGPASVSIDISARKKSAVVTLTLRAGEKYSRICFGTSCLDYFGVKSGINF